MPARAYWGLLLVLLAAEGALAEGERPNILLVTVDTFRPDHLGYYGYPLSTSPHLDSLSAEGVFFRQAFSTSGWTTPGLISILTSLHAPTHGVDIRGRRLDPEVITLADVLRQEGYRAPDIFFLTEIPNFSNLGLEPYARRDELIHRGDEILFHWLAQEAGAESPFFLYYHYRDLHLPYDPKDEYEELFLPGAFASSFGFLSAFKRFLAAEKIQLVKSSVMITRGAMDFDPERDRPWVRALYDAEIRQLDEEFFGRLRRTLAETGLAGNTLVVISADHGEELLDRDLIGHISTFKEGRLYDEIVRIPLIFWWPGRLPAGRVVEEPVQCIDIMPTLLELAGAPAPEGIQGHSLLPLIRGEPGWREKPLFFESSAGGFTADEVQYRQRFRAVRTARWKLVYEGPEERYLLYDLEADPGERRDVARQYGAVADTLKKMLNEWVLYSQKRPYQSAAPDPQPAVLEPEEEPGPPRILFPGEGDTLHYRGEQHTIRLRWTGAAQAPYVIEYEVGRGAYYLAGELTEASASPAYGPFQENFWNSLVLYNPWKFRVWREDRPQEKSPWVTFHLAPSGEGQVELTAALLFLRARSGLLFAGEQSVNLVRGLARGLLDLCLLLASVPAADLSAWVLIAVLAAAIAWPAVERVGRERVRAWGLALLYIAFVYSTIPLMPSVWAVLRDYTQGAIRYLGIVAVVLVGLALLWQVWRRHGRSTWRPYAALLLIAPVYAYLLHRYAVFPAERLHLVEYGFVGYFLFAALRLDLSQRAAYLAAFALTVLVGMGDECIQWLLPQRFFEVKDVQLNAISGGLGLLLLRFVLQPEERRKPGA